MQPETWVLEFTNNMFSTLLAGAQRNFAAVAARVGNLVDYPVLEWAVWAWDSIIVHQYVWGWTCVLVGPAPCSSSCSCRISSNRPFKLASTIVSVTVVMVSFSKLLNLIHIHCQSFLSMLNVFCTWELSERNNKEKQK